MFKNKNKKNNKNKNNNNKNKYTLYEGIGFEVIAEVLNGRIKIEVEGKLSRAVKPLIKKMIKLLHGEKAIKTSDQLYISTWLPPVPSKPFERYSKAQFHAILGRMTPDQVTIAITEECPNFCKHCALPDTKNKARLSLNEIKTAIEQALALGTTLVIFDGGEPLTYGDLSSAIKMVEGSKAISTLFTSGYGLTFEKALELKQAGLYAVNVSLDFPEEKRHDEMRGRVGVFTEAIEAIENCLKAGLLVDIYVVLSPENIDYLEDFYTLAVETNAHELTFYEIVPTGRWLNGEVLNESERIKLDRFIESVRNQAGPRVMSIPHIMKTTGCFAGRKWLHITPQGEVWPCACIPISYGNIKSQRLEEIWRRIRAQQIYRDLNIDCLMRNSEFRLKYLKYK
ncbi:MAG: radical SAM protein [Methanocellales archaeon]